MYDFLISLLSEELLTQAEYIHGALYLPAGAVFEELLCLVVPFFILSLILGGFFIVVDCISTGIRAIVRRFRRYNARRY